MAEFKAYRVTNERQFRGDELIYAAESRNRARYAACASARDADFEVKYIDFRAVRAPEFDEDAKEKGKLCCIGWSEADEWNRISGMKFGVLARKEEKDE